MTKLIQGKRFVNLLNRFEALGIRERRAIFLLWASRTFNDSLFLGNCDSLRQVFSTDDLKSLDIIDSILEIWKLDDVDTKSLVEPLVNELADLFEDENFLIYHPYQTSVLGRIILKNNGILSAVLGSNFVENIAALVSALAGISFSGASQSISQEPEAPIYSKTVEGLRFDRWLRHNNPGVDRLEEWLVRDTWIVQDPSRLRMLSGSRGRVLTVRQIHQYNEIYSWMGELPRRADGDPHTWWDKVTPKVAQQPDLVDWILGPLGQEYSKIRLDATG